MGSSDDTLNDSNDLDENQADENQADENQADPVDLADQVQDDESEQDEAGDGSPPKEKLSLAVTIDKPSACKRHITITVSREDIERYLNEAYGELTPKAEVRGFRAGRAPRKLVESQFKTQVRDQVKGSLLLDSLAQISEEHEFSAISEPDFDMRKVEIPDEGPMTFEFDLEVRPEFDMPNWKGLHLRRPVHEITESAVDGHLQNVLERHSRLVPHDGPAMANDSVVVNLVCRHGDQAVCSLDDLTVRVRRQLSFGDATISDFASIVTGAVAGETRTGKLRVHEGAANEALRGEEIDAEFQILEVKRQELPALTPAFLAQIGGFATADELRYAVRTDLNRRFRYHQQQAIRGQITKQLTASANWDLPEDLLKRQARRELDRAVMELQSSGFSAEEIQAHSNRLRQNVLANTATALREHFILERIAEEHKIEPTNQDYDLQIAVLATARNESPRRVRARLEKRGQMDTLRNQILEAKVIELVMSEASFRDEPFTWPETDVSAIAQTICAADEESGIPEAQRGGTEELRQPVERG